MKLIESGETDIKVLIDALMKTDYNWYFTKKTKYNRISPYENKDYREIMFWKKESERLDEMFENWNKQY